MKLPTLEWLQQHLNTHSELEGPNGVRLPVTLTKAELDMDKEPGSVSYSAILRLPMGSSAKEGVYRWYGDKGLCWDLLFVPIMPEPEDYPLLQAVMHYQEPEREASE